MNFHEKMQKKIDMERALLARDQYRSQIGSLRDEVLEQAARAITKHWRGIKGNRTKDNGAHWAATLVRSLKSKP